jgi:hypothetical protein
MTQKEIKALSNSELIYELIMNDRQACIEVNSRRGLTKKTANDTSRLIAECLERTLLSTKEADRLEK